MRQILIPAVLLSLLAGCSTVNIGPHRIDVQQGNALDQENVARLKPGLNRSQVRFLLGTPLVVDPFRNDRWDYVYVYHKAGRLSEQKRITLFFEGDVLVRIEGDLPQQESPAPQAPPAPAVSRAATPVAARPQAAGDSSAPAQVSALPAEPVPQPRPIAAPTPVPTAVEPARVQSEQPARVAPQPAAAATPAPVAEQASSAPAETVTSIVPPLPSPPGAPPYPNRRPQAELALQAETAVEQIQPDVIPPFPEPQQASVDSEAAVLAALKAWSEAWRQRDEEAYLAAYDASFVPQGGGSHEEWEKRRRMLLGLARNIDLRIESPAVAWAGDKEVRVTFNQHYRSDSYRDSVVKQLRMVERDGRWLIVEERVLTILRGARP